VTEVTISEGLKSRMTPDEQRKYGKLPAWLRDMVEGVQEDLDEATGALEERQEETRQKYLIAELWDDIADRRVRQGDPDGCLRACRAAALLREGVACATGQP
jgi:hypothetical protein